jgi:hypothetical protein
LLRHELLWQARKARQLREEIRILIPALAQSGEPAKDDLIALLTSIDTLTQEIEAYEFDANR